MKGTVTNRWIYYVFFCQIFYLSILYLDNFLFAIRCCTGNPMQRSGVFFWFPVHLGRFPPKNNQRSSLLKSPKKVWKNPAKRSSEFSISYRLSMMTGGDGVEIEASAWNKCVMNGGNFILFSIFVGAPFCMNRSMFLSNDLGMWEELRLWCLFCSENMLRCKLRCGCDRNSELFHSFSKNRWIFKANNQFPSLSIWNSFILGVSIPCLLL